MSKKRFINISSLPKAWRKLEPSLKLTWFYLWTHCDSAGIWEVDEDLFAFENGFELNLVSLKKALDTEIEICENLVLLKNFIEVNYGCLKQDYNPHKPVFRSISKNNLKLSPSLNQAYFKLVDEEEDKYEEEGKEEKEDEIIKKVVEIQKTKRLSFFDSEVFKKQWELWKVFRKKQHKFSFISMDSENRKLTALKNLANGNEQIAIEIIQQSIDNGWKGFFELKKQTGDEKINEADDNR